MEGRMVGGLMVGGVLVCGILDRAGCLELLVEKWIGRVRRA